MKKVVMFICSSLVLFPLQALCGDNQGRYITGHAGVAYQQDSSVSQNTGTSFDIEFDVGYDLGLAAGYDFGNFRLEGELGARTNQIDTYNNIEASEGEFYTITMLANSCYDIKISAPLSPFFCAGLGFARVSVDDLTVNNVSIADETDTVFAFQLGTGVSFAFWKNADMDVGYRYFLADDVEWSNASVEYEGHSITVGFRYYY